MPRQVVPLTDTKIRSLHASDKPINAFDGGNPHDLALCHGADL